MDAVAYVVAIPMILPRSTNVQIDTVTLEWWVEGHTLAKAMEKGPVLQEVGPILYGNYCQYSNLLLLEGSYML